MFAALVLWRELHSPDGDISLKLCPPYKTESPDQTAPPLSHVMLTVCSVPIVIATLGLHVSGKTQCMSAYDKAIECSTMYLRFIYAIKYFLFDD